MNIYRHRLRLNRMIFLWDYRIFFYISYFMLSKMKLEKRINIMKQMWIYKNLYQFRRNQLKNFNYFTTLSAAWEGLRVTRQSSTWEDRNWFVRSQTVGLKSAGFSVNFPNFSRRKIGFLLLRLFKVSLFYVQTVEFWV